MKNETSNRCRIVLLAMLLLLAACSQNLDRGRSEDASGGRIVRTEWVSKTGERMVAIFDRASDTVDVRLPDGRSVTLARVISGSGARYSIGDEVFWEHQDAVTYTIRGQLVFEGTKSQAPVD